MSDNDPAKTPLTESPFFTKHLGETGEKYVVKWDHYLPVYEREFARFKTRPISFLEIGVFLGGSLPMWKGYFPEGSRLTFIDIDPKCKEHEIEGTKVEIGNQADPEFLERLGKEYGPFDVILDDGSHVCEHQIASFKGLWKHLTDGGLYVVEDCHSSYWPGFGGGYRAKDSFIEFSKNLIDAMHSWYTDQDDIFPFNPAARLLNAVRYYDSIVAIEKLRVEPPTVVESANGECVRYRTPLKIRGRTSIFAGKDGR